MTQTTPGTDAAAVLHSTAARVIRLSARALAEQEPVRLVQLARLLQTLVDDVERAAQPRATDHALDWGPVLPGDDAVTGACACGMWEDSAPFPEALFDLHDAHQHSTGAAASRS